MRWDPRGCKPARPRRFDGRSRPGGGSIRAPFGARRGIIAFMMEVAEVRSPVAVPAPGRPARCAAALTALLSLLVGPLGLPALPARASSLPEGAEAALGGFEGLWLRVESDEEERALLASIERTLSTIPGLLRGLASGVMRRQIKPAGRYEFALEGGEFWLATGGRNRHPLPLDGQPRERRDGDGKAVTVTSQITADGALATTWQRDDSHGSEVYRLGEDGHTLVVEATIASPHFEVPVEFRSTFRRSAGVSAGP